MLFGSRFSGALLCNLADFATEIHFGREKPEHVNAPNIQIGNHQFKVKQIDSLVTPTTSELSSFVSNSSNLVHERLSKKPTNKKLFQIPLFFNFPSS